MGNNICCQETKTHGPLDKHDHGLVKKSIFSQNQQNNEMPGPKSEIKYEIAKTQVAQKPDGTILTPELKYEVADTILNKKFFAQEQKNQLNISTKRYGGDTYVGTLGHDGQKPHGFGKMYKENKAYYIGYFNYGRAEGKGAYIFADGSYYFGEFHNNQTNCKNGQYWSNAYHYRGGFINNVFQGEGVEQAKDYVFRGKFHNGSRTEGLLTWTQNGQTNNYNGQFNYYNQFHGKGVLKQAEGTYTGYFQNGLKHGQGVYTFAIGSKYEGGYVNGVRQGKGTIFNREGKPAYVGNFKNGLPNGKGSVIDPAGKPKEFEWVDGIQKSHLYQ